MASSKKRSSSASPAPKRRTSTTASSAKANEMVTYGNVILYFCYYCINI